MIRDQFIFDLNEELLVDNFAGGGGASTGIELALGRHVDLAFNHDRLAMGMHRMNHRQTVHHCEDVFDVVPAIVCGGRPVGLAHFSPDCKHHSKAKGGKPLDKRIRGLVVVMLRWAKYRSRVMTMENVEEIQKWSPLIWECRKGKWGWYPDARYVGRTWKAFLACLGTGIDPDHPDLPEILDMLNTCRGCDGKNPSRETCEVCRGTGEVVTITRNECIRGFGYTHQARELRACDYGSPTIRKRLFMVARCDGRDIVWPEADHFDPKLKENWRKQFTPYRIIAECVDWWRPCPSIFDSKATIKALYGVDAVRPLADSTMRRAATGIGRYTIHTKNPFLVSLTHQGGDRVEPIDEPARAITGAHRGEKAVVVARYNGSHQGKTDGANRNQSADVPLTVQDTSPRFGLTEASLAPFITEHANATHQRNFPADECLRTACAETKGGTFALVAANILVNNAHHTGAAATDPAPTIPTGGHHAVVTGALIGAGGPTYSGEPKKVTAPLHSLTAKPTTSLAAASLVQTGYGEREGQAPRCLDLNKPGGTAVAGGVKQAVVTGALVHTAHGEADKEGNPRRGRGARSVRESMPTVTTSNDGALATASIIKMRGTNVGHAADEPVHVVSADGQHHGVVAAHVIRHFGESVGQEVQAPAPTTTASGGGKTGVVSAHVTKFRTGSVGSSMKDPGPTVTSGSHSPETHGGAGGTQGVVAAYLAQHNAGFNETPGHPATDPISTIGTKGCQQQVVAAALVPPCQGTDDAVPAAGEHGDLSIEDSFIACSMTPEQLAGAYRVAAFLRSYGVEFEGAFAKVAGGYVIYDIGMRMLTPRELFRAQGFTDSYEIDRALVPDENGLYQLVDLTKEQQVRLCGNSVCPQVMQAIVRANVPELAVWYRHEEPGTARFRLPGDGPKSPARRPARMPQLMHN